jgi:regulator of replication initiation timing
VARKKQSEAWLELGYAYDFPRGRAKGGQYTEKKQGRPAKLKLDQVCSEGFYLCKCGHIQEKGKEQCEICGKSMQWQPPIF